MNSPDTLSYDSDLPSEEQAPSHPKLKIQAKFQIARPPPKSHQLLRLSPKLILQIQQLPPNHRPVPVLEIWQPPLRKSKLTRGFPHQPKLGARDIYATLNEPYVTTTQKQRAVSEPSEQCAQDKDIVAAMCSQSSNEETASAIHFRDARCIWQACPASTATQSSSTAGSEQASNYRFTIVNAENTGGEEGRMLMQWERRLDGEKGEQFVLVAIDRKARRKSRIASMTRDGVEINVRKSSVLEHLRLCLLLTDPVAGSAGDDFYGNLEIWLYTHVLTLGVWVASMEGWLSL
ncbi:uncharacterized protein N7511_010406 [Penicillium nucicola]|uniref:uncharacterized protein n=1 Tax=Penicillium nucicola TaxID=1850975 RepID=UPI002545AD0D|nr:uncharacterized protein N7511_010406 [Penicillium nucicola]KAJ5748710.1 hypothetical protein N7511_010406 [Penicillium nucicola]